MPNARDIQGADHESVLLIGPFGGGKSTQYQTLPGNGFVYAFDPNAKAAYRGGTFDYEEFLPDMLDINVQPLAKDKRGDRVVKAHEPESYTRWEKHFDDAYNSGFFDAYDWVGIDSFTTFSDSVMDRVLYLNGRLGKMPEQADWSAQMITIQNVFRTLAAMGKLLVCTAHEEWKQDELTKRVWSQPVMTGRLRIRIPLLFSNIFRCTGDGERYFFETAIDRQHEYMRTSIRGLPAKVDVTIEDWERPTEYGLGKLLRDGGRLASVQTLNKAPAAKRA